MKIQGSATIFCFWKTFENVNFDFVEALELIICPISSLIVCQFNSNWSYIMFMSWKCVMHFFSNSKLEFWLNCFQVVNFGASPPWLSWSRFIVTLGTGSKPTSIIISILCTSCNGMNLKKTKMHVVLFSNTCSFWSHGKMVSHNLSCAVQSKQRQPFLVYSFY